MPIAVTFEGGAGGLSLVGATLVDARTDAFFPLVLSERFWLVHSGDVKIYENLGPRARAFFVAEAQRAADSKAALDAMAAPDFDPTQALVLLGNAQPPSDPTPTLDQPEHENLEITAYEPARVVIDVQAARPGYVVLADAWYPGWRAEVAPLTGEGAAADAPVLQADLLFRAVPVQAGAWRVTLTYRPRLVWVGGAVSVGGLLAWVGYAVAVRRGRETGPN
jgi:hypothetical protein